MKLIPFKWVGFKEKKKLDYPIPFGFVTYTPEALDEGVKDDQNKIILIYNYNLFGKLIERRYRYSDSRLKVLEDRGIPIFDKTKGEDRFPVYSKLMPGEAVYTTKW